MADTVDNREERLRKHREADQRRRAATPKQHPIRLNRQKAYLQRRKATETEERGCSIDTE